MRPVHPTRTAQTADVGCAPRTNGRSPSASFPASEVIGGVQYPSHYFYCNPNFGICQPPGTPRTRGSSDAPAVSALPLAGDAVALTFPDLLFLFYHLGSHLSIAIHPRSPWRGPSTAPKSLILKDLGLSGRSKKNFESGVPRRRKGALGSWRGQDPGRMGEPSRHRTMIGPGRHGVDRPGGVGRPSTIPGRESRFALDNRG